jgi:hypothetical protein
LRAWLGTGGSANAFRMTLGGLDYNLTDRIAIRLVKVG